MKEEVYKAQVPTDEAYYTEAEVKELYLALDEAKEIISIMWHSGKKHGGELWDFYQLSPEMRHINYPLYKYKHLKQTPKP